MEALGKKIRLFWLKLHPQSKFIYFLSLLLLILISSQILFLTLLFLFHLSLFLFLTKHPKSLLKSYQEPFLIALLLLLIKSVTLSSLKVDFNIFYQNLYLALRILTAFTLFLLFSSSLKFFELAKLMSWLKVPAFFTELVYLTTKFISLLKEEIYSIYLAQKNRLGYVNLKNSLRSLNYLIQTGFFQSLRRSENLVHCMEQRGFDFKNLPFPLEKISSQEKFFLILLITSWFILWIIL